jgi:hypothetical protein
LLDRLLADADARQVPVGLCATEQGRPLYASRGFEVSGELVILFGRPEQASASESRVTPSVDAERVVAQDRELSGCQRDRMLRARFAEARATYELGSGRRGFGMATLHGENALIGPILAESEDDARALCQALCAAVACPVRIDVPVQHVGLRGWLTQLGLREMSVRAEMARGASRMPWQVGERFALASQAWG